MHWNKQWTTYDYPQEVHGNCSLNSSLNSFYVEYSASKCSQLSGEELACGSLRHHCFTSSNTTLRDNLTSIQHTLFFSTFFLFSMIKYSWCCKPRFISSLTVSFIKHKEISHTPLDITITGFQINIGSKKPQNQILHNNWIITESSLSSQTCL